MKTRKVVTIAILSVFFLVSAAMLSTCGGGGGGDSTTSHPPGISDISPSRSSAEYMEGGGAVYVEATFNFIDEGSDLEFCTLCSSGPTGWCSDVYIPEAKGITIGTLWVAGMIDTTVIGTWDWTLNCTDLDGNTSNTLSGKFIVY